MKIMNGVVHHRSYGKRPTSQRARAVPSQVQEADLVEQLSILVEDGCLAHLLMHVYTYILHWMSPWVVCERHAPMGSLRTIQVAAQVLAQS